MKRLVVTVLSLCCCGALAFMSASGCGNLLPKPDVAAIESEGADDVVSTNRETTDDSAAFEARQRAEREAQQRAERENAYADRPLDVKDFRPVGEEIYIVPELCPHCRGNGGRYDPPYDLTAVFVECKNCNSSGWVYKRKTRTIYSDKRAQKIFDDFEAELDKIFNE